ncbi:MocR-like transcription factor YczR [Actinocorallia populi]|uniref:MocR-like transcription factor YczR n=1 Tax=Actinocorallia populi TaxID=2079200 RepID=UPI000D08EEB2|nr:PLP-dependent aminotransferase family protein [Actinocorallia populi]
MGDVRYVSGLQLARLLGELPAERPFYAVLAAGVRALIQDGRLPLGVRLPAERDLAVALSVSRTTVTSAYDALREDGYVSSRQGSGSWTTLPPVAMAHHSPATAFTATPVGSHSDTIDLGCAAPGAPGVFAEAVDAAVRELPRYSCGAGYQPAGLPVLRAAIAERYTARGVPTRPEEIVITTGAQQACDLLVRTLVDRGDAVMLERPTYPHVLSALRSRGARLVPVGVADGWDLDLIAAGMRQAAVRLGYFIPDFQNPTGHLMSQPDRAALVEAARAAQGQLVIDEAFAELGLDADAGVPVAAHDTGGRVITVGSASKLFWGGLRIGWIRTTVPLARRLASAREPLDISSPVLEQLITAELFRRLEEVRAERKAGLTASRDALVAALEARLPAWRFTVPVGGMTVWARLPAPVASAFCEVALRHGVRIVPGPVFGADGVLEDAVRLPYVLRPDTMREAVERMAAAYTEAEALPAARSLPAFV